MRNGVVQWAIMNKHMVCSLLNSDADVVSESKAWCFAEASCSNTELANDSIELLTAASQVPEHNEAPLDAAVRNCVSYASVISSC